MKIGNFDFEVNKHTYIMGILNVTQDSFSDGGKFNDVDRALFQAEKMINEGAHIIDIGGESTRPGYIPVPAEQEIERVIPIIEKVKSEFNIAISLDTQKSIVARAGIKAGIDIVNDIWGLKGDAQMADVIAAANVHCVLMHNRDNTDYDNFLDNVYTDLAETLNIASKAGISEDKIILDPGIGFAKDTKQNLELMAHVDKLKLFGCPVLLAASRKSVIGNTLNLPVDQRLEGTLALTALAVSKGCAFVRVHDVKENKRIIDMLEAVYEYK